MRRTDHDDKNPSYSNKRKKADRYAETDSGRESRPMVTRKKNNNNTGKVCHKTSIYHIIYH